MVSVSSLIFSIFFLFRKVQNFVFRSGFAIFWDFICGITQAKDQCRIVVTMFKESEAVSDSKVLPAVPCSPSNDNAMPYARYSGRIAILGIKQIFPR